MPRIPRLVDHSVALYRFLLAVYPTAFRNEFGEAMTQLFRDTALDGYRRHGLLGLSAVWLRTLLDFTNSVLRQHLDKPVTVSSESVLLRDFLRKWGQLGCNALSATAFSAWYGLHLLRLYFWATLTVIAFGIWFTSFFDTLYLMRNAKALRITVGGGLVEIRHVYDVGKPISDEQWWREARARVNEDATLNDRLQRYPWPWEFSLISDIYEGSVIQLGPDRKPELIQPYKFWLLRFHFGFFPLLMLWWTIRVYRRRKASPAAAMQSA